MSWTREWYSLGGQGGKGVILQALCALVVLSTACGSDETERPVSCSVDSDCGALGQCGGQGCGAMGGRCFYPGDLCALIDRTVCSCGGATENTSGCDVRWSKEGACSAFAE